MLIFCLFAAELSDLYAFQYTAPDIANRLCGWDVFDVQSEYLRMGVPNSNWVLTNINKDYEVSNTVSRWSVPNSNWVLTNINKDYEVSNTVWVGHT